MPDDLDWLFGPEGPDLAAARATPVTVLTGFLGAGKTTLVNRILAEEHGLRIAVLVNDFGSVDVDSELIVGVEAGTISLANGCVCCEVRDDLIAAIDSVLAQDGDLDALVLEASGVAEPIGIARTFTAPAYRGRLRVDGIVAVVDAERLPDQAADPAVRDLVFGQIGFADLVVLNKIDLADRTRVGAVRDFIGERLPAVRIVEASYADVPFDVLVGDGPRIDREEDWLDDREHVHGRFHSWVYARGEASDPYLLTEAFKRLPSSVYRVKGFLSSADQPGFRHLVQAVGMRGDVQPYDEWGDRDPRTALVVIGSDPADREAVEVLLDSALDS